MLRFVTLQLGANGTQNVMATETILKGKRNSMINLYNGLRVYVRNYNKVRPLGSCCSSVQNRLPTILFKTGGWEGSQTKFGSDSKNSTIEKR